MVKIKLIIEITGTKELVGVEYLKQCIPSMDDAAPFHDNEGNVIEVTSTYMRLINAVSNHLSESLTSGGVTLDTENEESLEERYGENRINLFFYALFQKLALLGLSDFNPVELRIVPGGYALEVTLEKK